MSGQLTLRDVTVSYFSRPVVEHVSLQIRTGELCALLGLNGSGKSTLLRAVCGLLPCRCGEMSVDGHDISAMRERERARWISYIPQRGSAGTGLSVLDVILMGFNARLGLLEAPTQGQRATARKTLERLGLSGFEERLFDRLSEGQRQLVVFARALVQDSPIMLLDEPDSALDFVHRHRMLEQIARVVREEKKAALITLHDPNFAMTYCDRLILLHNGGVAGDIAMSEASTELLSAELSKLYGDIHVVEYAGQRCILRCIPPRTNK